MLIFSLLALLFRGGQTLNLPSYPEIGNYALRVKGSNYFSESINLQAISPVAGEIPIRWLSVLPLVLELGPIIDSSGALVDDGSIVGFIIQGKEEALFELNKSLQNGFLTWELPPLPKEAQEIKVLVAGERKSLTLPKYLSEP